MNGVAASQTQVLSTMTASFMKQGAAQAQAMAALLEQSADNAKALAAAPPAGMGQAVDISA